MRLRRVADTPDTPERPSHFGEDQNQRVPENTGPVEWGTEPSPDSIAPAPLPAMDIMPVVIMQPLPRDWAIRRASMGTNTLSATDPESFQICSNDLNRTRFVVANLDDADTIWITNQRGNKSTALATGILPGKEREFLHNQELYAFVTANTAVVTFHAEYLLDK